MKFRISKIKSVKLLDQINRTVYDVGMKDSPNTFFANNILVHNSVFFPAKPLIEKLKPQVLNDDKKMVEETLKITSKVQSVLNEKFDSFSEKFLCVKDHNFDLKQEVIAKKGMWVAKKRYILWIINKKGVPKDELDFTGVDAIKSDFPFAFRKFSEKLVNDILRGRPKNEIDDMILDFKEKIHTIPINDVGVPKSVNYIEKYTRYKVDSKGRKKPMKMINDWMKSTPIHTKAAISYNELLDFFNLSDDYEKIIESEKIKYVYLKENEFNLNVLGFKGYDDPPEIIEIIEKYIDKNKIFESNLKKKVTQFLNAAGWVFPTISAKLMSEFIVFE